MKVLSKIGTAVFCLALAVALANWLFPRAMSPYIAKFERFLAETLSAPAARPSSSNAAGDVFLGRDTDGCEHFYTSVTKIYSVNQESGVSAYNGRLRIGLRVECPPGTTTRLSGGTFIAYTQNIRTEWIDCSRQRLWSESSLLYNDNGNGTQALVNSYQARARQFAFEDDPPFRIVNVTGFELERAESGEAINPGSFFSKITDEFCPLVKPGTPVRQ